MTRVKYFLQDYGWRLLGVVIILGVISFAVTHNPSGKHAPPKASSTATSSTSGTPTGPSTSSTAIADDPQVKQMVAIIQAYYLLGPKDNVASRKQHLKGLLPAAALQALDFSVGHRSCSDLLRISRGLTEKATVDTSGYTGDKVGNGLVYSTLPVTVQQYDARDKPVKDTATCVTTESFRVFFNWQQAGDSWKLVGFGDPATHWSQLPSSPS